MSPLLSILPGAAEDRCSDYPRTAATARRGPLLPRLTSASERHRGPLHSLMTDDVAPAVRRRCWMQPMLDGDPAGRGPLLPPPTSMLHGAAVARCAAAAAADVNHTGRRRGPRQQLIDGDPAGRHPCCNCNCRRPCRPTPRPAAADADDHPAGRRLWPVAAAAEVDPAGRYGYSLQPLL